MSWLPRERIIVNVEAESVSLRTHDRHPPLFIVRACTFVDSPEPGRVIQMRNVPTRAIPFAGIFMPRPEWVW